MVQSDWEFFVIRCVQNTGVHARLRKSGKFKSIEEDVAEEKRTLLHLLMDILFYCRLGEDSYKVKSPSY